MLLEEKVKIFELSEFLILSYTKNQKLGNLGKRVVKTEFANTAKN